VRSQTSLNFAILVIPLIAGIFFGYLIRGRRKANLAKLTFAIVLTLMFSLGFGIGSNNEMLSSLPQVGLSALIIASLAIAFSVLLVKALKGKAGLQ
jgi:hypothetical protein